MLAEAFKERLPEAEACLDEIAETGRWQAHEMAPNPAPLLALIDETRRLSTR